MMTIGLNVDGKDLRKKEVDGAPFPPIEEHKETQLRARLAIFTHVSTYQSIFVRDTH